jgi:lipopolysaccharide/colanic/teichoic acid biosynthesis glycosyltransferase
MIREKLPSPGFRSSETIVRSTPISLIYRPRATQTVKQSALAFRTTLLFKTWFDRLGGITLIVLTWPIMVLAMMVVKLTSRGPAVYSQKRVGQYGRVFTIYKVRTMYHNCESLTGPRWSTPHDPRVTFVGNILRKLHIDELPQLWNVLKGEMSLIGPRPERPEIASNLKDIIDDYDRRISVKPGISGEAQIHLPPDTCINSVRKKLVFDRKYIDKMSVFRDLKIMFFTGLKMFGFFRLNETETSKK